MYPLVIQAMPPSPKHLEQLAETIGRIAFNGALKRHNHGRISVSVRPIAVYGVTDASDSPGSTEAGTVSLLQEIHQFSSNSRL